MSIEVLKDILSFDENNEKAIKALASIYNTKKDGTSLNKLIKDYKDNKAEFFPNIFAPWELFGCNCYIKNNVWVTIYSSAFCAYYFAIENFDNSNKYIFLYKILISKKIIQESKILDMFLINLKNKSSKVFMPNTIERIYKYFKNSKRR